MSSSVVAGTSDPPLSTRVRTVVEEAASAIDEARVVRERLRSALADADAAVVAAEGAARRRLEGAVGDWSAEQAERSSGALAHAVAWSLAAELDDLRTNREVVLDTIHPSLHGEIAGAFDRRIEELEERVRGGRDLGDEPAPPDPIVLAAAWLRHDPPGIDAVVLDVGPHEVDAAARAALSELCRSADVRDLGELPGGRHLAADLGARSMEMTDVTEVARALGRRLGERLSGVPGWPASAQPRVEPIEADAARAISAVLTAAGSG